jgi:hypothetical protein
MRRLSLWRNWLVVLGLGLAAFGVGMTLFNNTPIFAVFNDRIDPVFWPEGIPAQGRVPFRSWVYGAWGATVAGWGLTLFFIARYPFAGRKLWAWQAVLWSLLLWYALDTGVSLRFGVTVNVILNTAILALALIPLLASRKAFARRSAGDPAGQGSPDS